MIKSKGINKIVQANPDKAISTHKDSTTFAQLY